MLPSVDEAFGVAYIEAMAGGVPAIGSRGEPGPEEIARLRRRDAARRRPATPRRSPRELRALLDEPAWRRELGAAARANVEANFTWERLRPRDRRRLRGRAAVTRARPVRHQPRAAVPRRRVRGAARARERRLRADRRRRPPRRRRNRRDASSRSRRSSRAERAVARLAASGRFRAVVAGLSGRVALPAAYAGARAGRVPFVLWATIWRHPRTPAHAALLRPAAPPLPPRGRDRHLRPARQRLRARPSTRRARSSKRRRASTPRSGRRPAQPERHGDFQILFAGRLAPEKGVDVLAAARGREGTLVLAGEGPLQPAGAIVLGRRDPVDLRNLYAGSDVVVVPSIPTRDFLEPWGLVVNEAFHQGVPVIATDAVGAAAGGLVQHERTGLVVPAGDAAALARRPATACATTPHCARGSATRRRDAVAGVHARRRGRRACRGRCGRGRVERGLLA